MFLNYYLKLLVGTNEKYIISSYETHIVVEINNKKNVVSTKKLVKFGAFIMNTMTASTLYEEDI